MRLKLGSRRMALILGSLVIKVPRSDFFMNHCQGLLQRLWHGQWRGASRLFGFALRYHWSAIRQNWTEFQAWWELRAKFLAPTYFSCGILNLQRYVEGESPTLEDLAALWKGLSDSAQRDFRSVNSHCLWEPANIAQTPNGYCLVDYGDKTGALRRFLIRNRQEIEEHLRR